METKLVHFVETGKQDRELLRDADFNYLTFDWGFEKDIVEETLPMSCNVNTATASGVVVMMTNCAHGNMSWI